MKTKGAKLPASFTKDSVTDISEHIMTDMNGNAQKSNSRLNTDLDHQEMTVPLPDNTVTSMVAIVTSDTVRANALYLDMMMTNPDCKGVTLIPLEHVRANMDRMTNDAWTPAKMPSLCRSTL